MMTEYDTGVMITVWTATASATPPRPTSAPPRTMLEDLGVVAIYRVALPD